MVNVFHRSFMKEEVINEDSTNYKATDVNSKTWLFDIKILLGRNIKQTLRNPLLFKSIVIELITVSLLIGGLYFKLGKKTYESDWLAVQGIVYFMSMASILVL